MSLDYHRKRGVPYAIAYYPGRYLVLDVRTGATLSEHKSKAEARSAIKRYKAVDVRRAPTPLERLRYHVTGAIERGEAVAVVEKK